MDFLLLKTENEGLLLAENAGCFINHLILHFLGTELLLTIGNDSLLNLYN